MKLIVTPFGPPAWERRREILKDIIAARPGLPRDFRDVLYLVPNERALKKIKVLFLEALNELTGGAGCIPPYFSTLNNLAASRAASASAAPPVDPMTRALLLEEICAKAAASVRGVPPLPDSAGPSLAPLISAALDDVYSHGVDGASLKSEAGESVPLALFLKAKNDYEAWLKRHGFSDPSALKYAYRPALGDFANFSTVILDGFYDATPAEMPTLKALSASPDFRFLIEAPGLGRHESGGEGMPYCGTSELLGELLGEMSNKTETDAEAGLFLNAVFGGRTLRESRAAIDGLRPAVSRRIEVIGATTPAEEVYFMARSIKRGVLTGRLKDLNKVLVFFPALDSYLAVMEEAFGELGVPYHVSQGYPIVQSTVFAALNLLFSLPMTGYSKKAINRAASSPLIALPEDGRLPAFETFDRGHATLSEWAGATLRFMEQSGLIGKVSELGAVRPMLQAGLSELAALLERMQVAANALKGRMRAGEFVYALKRSARDVRYAPHKDAVSGVRVLGRLEVLSEPFDVIYAGGLIEGALPAALASNVLFPGDSVRRLGLPGPLMQRSRDARLFLELLLGAPEVYLCHPETSERGPVPPSPYLRALEPFFEAGVIGRSRNVCRPADPAEAMSPSELLRSLSLGVSTPGKKLTDAAKKARPAPPEKRRFKVTELEEYKLCHYRYYQSHVVGSKPAEEPEDDAAPHKAGSLVHDILRRFYDAVEKDGPVTAANRDAALRRLRAIADGEFSHLPDTLRNRMLKKRFMESIAPKFIEAEVELAETGFSVCPPEMDVEIEVDDKEMGTFVITGKLDRLELDREGNFTVVDYKTGSYPGSAGGPPIKEQFQLPLYAYMVKSKGEAAAGKRPARPAGLVYYDLGREMRMRDVVAYDAELAPDALVKKFSRRKLAPEKMEEMLKGSYEAAVEAVREIMKGRFEPSCTDEKFCQRCVYMIVCEKGSRVEGNDGEDED